MNAAAINPSPSGPVTRTPTRPAIFEAKRDSGITTAATGQESDRGLERRVAEHQQEVGPDQEGRPGRVVAGDSRGRRNDQHRSRRASAASTTLRAKVEGQEKKCSKMPD